MNFPFSRPMVVEQPRVSNQPRVLPGGPDRGEYFPFDKHQTAGVASLGIPVRPIGGVIKSTLPAISIRNRSNFREIAS
jgi:hypothetical protein